LAATQGAALSPGSSARIHPTKKRRARGTIKFDASEYRDILMLSRFSSGPQTPSLNHSAQPAAQNFFGKHIDPLAFCMVHVHTPKRDISGLEHSETVGSPDTLDAPRNENNGRQR
jgi:hypothetical protein